MSDVDRQIGGVPFVRLQLLLAPVVEMCLRLQGTEPLRECLGVLRGEAYLLAGRIAFELRDDTAAHRWYAEAIAAAGDPTRRAVARTSYAMTMLHSIGDGAARASLRSVQHAELGELSEASAGVGNVHPLAGGFLW